MTAAVFSIQFSVNKQAVFDTQNIKGFSLNFAVTRQVLLFTRVFYATHKGEVVYANLMKVSAGNVTLIHKIDSMRN